MRGVQRAIRVLQLKTVCSDELYDQITAILDPDDETRVHPIAELWRHTYRHLLVHWGSSLLPEWRA